MAKEDNRVKCHFCGSLEDEDEILSTKVEYDEKPICLACYEHLLVCPICKEKIAKEEPYVKDTKSGKAYHYDCSEFICKNGHVLDRDLNAAKNILKEGLKIYRQELAITKVESKSDFGNKARSMKPEAHPIAFGVGG